MGVLGTAIANYLVGIDGLYSVELPDAMVDDLIELVQAANASTPNRAIYVTDDTATGVVPVPWREVLKWRGTDDRIFAWKRGAREPDTSFRSVVRPFIASRFPGAGGGECTSDMLVRLSITELWRRRGHPPVGDSFEHFCKTARWVCGVLRHVFETTGSTPSIHWSDRYLQHWSAMLAQLDSGLATFGIAPDPRHAWEIVRVSGLPLPSPLVDGNPFAAPPKELEEKEWAPLGDLWTKVVNFFIMPQGGLPLLLSALDRGIVGASQVNSWRGLPWSTALSNLAIDTPSPIAGASVFASASSPTMLTTSVPLFPVAPIPSWWGVSSDNLADAIRYLTQETPLVPDPAGPGLLPLYPALPTPYVLNTRSGTVVHAHTAKKWRARVTVDDIRLKFKQDWQTLHYSPIQPATPAEGDAWIHPDSIEIAAKGAKESSRAITATAGNQLSVTLGLMVEYPATLDNQTGALSGTWNPSRSLKIELRVRRFVGGAWDTGRSVAEELELIVPSPFSPTVIVGDASRVAGLAPDNQDEFTANRQAATPWIAATTPTIILKEEGDYDVTVYDGALAANNPAFTASAQPSVNVTSFAAPSDGLFPSLRSQLDDGDLVTNADPASSADIAVFNVKERSTNLSSGLLSAVRGQPAGRKQPSSIARQSLLGQYQVGVARAISASMQLNSLFQYIISSTDVPVPWPNHPGTPQPFMLFNAPPGFSLPGVGAGPSAALMQSAEWTRFMAAIATVRTQVGIDADTWISGADLGVIPAQTIRDYCLAQRDLVQRARQSASTDVFWASYPFSVFVVEGRSGVSFGQLSAVLLSPLHPARLTWAFGVTRIATGNTGDAALLGLLEGWNIPCTGIAFNPAGQARQLVAVPTDPGQEQDFVAWSALAVLSDNGLADLPVLGAGQQLPWGGRTGINARVVERALGDYCLVHPHINSLELDIRSVSPAPRSQEIDEAVLSLVGAGEADHVGQLGGATRVWDSDDRQGSAPTRDRLFAKRGDRNNDAPFEWRTYQPGSPPPDADIAIIENASVHLAVLRGIAEGVLGLIPLRRFSPTKLQNLALDQHFRPAQGEDLFGLADLLREIEAPTDLGTPALRATPQLHALGIGQGARWEVLGTFNLDPALLASVVASSAMASGTRLLWEWRPSWMSTERKHGDLARRPYYVVARIPASLLAALVTRQGFSTQNASELLGTLGRHGVGLAALTAEGGTKESAAAGFFYSVRLLLPVAGTGFSSRLGANPPLIGVLPLDPAEPILQALAGRKLDKRADLLAIALRLEAPGTLRLCFVPIEVKHHGMPSQPESIPPATDAELGRARQQLAQTAALIRDIAVALSAPPTQAEAATSYLKRLALATLLDLAMNFTPDGATATDKSAILRAVLSGTVSIGVGDGVLLWFAPGSMQSSGGACVVDRYGATTVSSTRIREVFIDPHVLPGLWWTGAQAGPNDAHARTQVDDVLVAAFSSCGVVGTSTSTDLSGALLATMGLSQPPTVPIQSAPTGTPASSPATEASTAPAAPAPLTPAATPVVPSPRTQTPSPQGGPDQASPASQAPSPALAAPAAAPAGAIAAPRAIVGWAAPASRWTIVGKLAGGEDTVALDLDHPKTVGVYGYMGSGKSYLLGNLIESAVKPIPGINLLPVPLAVVVFNYRRNASDRFELSSLALPNCVEADVERLHREYSAAPLAVDDMHILCLPGELRASRQQEYGPLPATELFFDPRTLGAEDWELLMGEPGSEAVFARTIRNTLQDLRSVGDITLELLERQVSARLSGQSRTAARLRFDFVRRYLSPTRGTDFNHLVRPGRVLVVDLRQPLFNKDDALRFFLVCANQISKVQGQFNKMIVFDEAHEYMSDAFGERMESRIRLMRHEGTSYVFATQDVQSIPLSISRFLTTRFVFDLGTRENVQDLEQAAPEFRGYHLLGVRPGSCFLHASTSSGGMFSRPREIRVRPRVTQHGGASQIFSTGSTPPSNPPSS